MKRLILAVIGLVGLAGCVSLFPESVAPQALYRLGANDASATVDLTKSILIRQPEAPRVLAGVDMTARDARGAIRLIEGVEWADRPPRLFQMSLLDHLGSGGEGAAILPETGARADYELAWRISEFSLQGNVATARVELTLLEGRSRVPLLQETVMSDVRASGSRPSLRAEALADAGRDVVRQAAQFVSENTP